MKDKSKDKFDFIPEGFDRDEVIIKLEKALSESENGEYQDWEEFKAEWRAEDKINPNNQ